MAGVEPGATDGAVPGVALAGHLTRAAGSGRRYAGLGDGAVIVAAGRWHAVEGWAFAQQLAAVREMVRRRPAPGPTSGPAPSSIIGSATGPAPGTQAQHPGGLPAVWRKDLAEEIALELALTRIAADKLINLAWTLEVRLPLTGAALEAGILDAAKARLIADETAVLSDQDARKAEALIAARWAGKTWTQLRLLISQAVINTDPEGAERRRERAEREQARVRFWREHAGTAAIAGYGLPADEALKAVANVQKRARAYKRWGIPEPMDLLRVMAFLDLLNGADARTRYPKNSQAARHRDAARVDQTARDHADDAADGMRDDDADDMIWDDEPDASPGDGLSGDDGPGDGGGPGNGEGPGDGGGPGNGEGPDGRRDGPGGPPDGDGPGGGPDGDSPDAGTGPGGGAAAGDDGLAANLDLTIPLGDLTGMAQRAGEARELGALDPGLARRLAAEAARHPRSTIRVIITNDQGRAIGFGQATRGRPRRPGADKPPEPTQPAPGTPPGGTPMAEFIPVGTGPADGYGSWTLTIGERVYTVRLHPIPDGECDHRYASAGYQPSETLRRLVQVRDGQCAMPVCVRHPRGCDWEHAVPWPRGRTCACNGGYHCRHDHHIKQTQGWKVEQLPDGRRRWTTPSGLRYTKGPKEYPV